MLPAGAWLAECKPPNRWGRVCRCRTASPKRKRVTAPPTDPASFRNQMARKKTLSPAQNPQDHQDHQHEAQASDGAANRSSVFPRPDGHPAAVNCRPGPPHPLTRRLDFVEMLKSPQEQGPVSHRRRGAHAFLERVGGQHLEVIAGGKDRGLPFLVGEVQLVVGGDGRGDKVTANSPFPNFLAGASVRR